MSDTLTSNEQVTPVDGLIAESRAVLATHLNGTWKDDYAALRLAQMVRALLARIEETTALQRELQRARDTIDTFEMEANPRPAHEPEVESPPVEVWNGDRKVTIYEDVVIRVWGPHIENEMSDEPRSHESVNAAIKWLYSSEPPCVWQPIETAPTESDHPILMTDGQWFAAGYVGHEDYRKYRIHHFAVCQEYDWEPTHWMPLPSSPVTKGGEL
jgi:hypothetical protein